MAKSFADHKILIRVTVLVVSSYILHRTADHMSVQILSSPLTSLAVTLRLTVIRSRDLQ